MYKAYKAYNDKMENILPSIKSESVDIILTDPPYLYLKNQKLDKQFDEELLFNEAKRVLKKDGFIVLFGRGTSFYRWNTMLANLGFQFKEEIVWDKMQPSSPMNQLSRRHETISIHTKRNGVINKVKLSFVEANKHDTDKISEAIYRLTTTFGNRKTFDLVKEYYETGEYRHNEGKDRKFSTTLQTDIKKTNRTLQFAINMEEGVMERSIIREVREHYSAIHPTQKPVRLLERLLNLVLPKDVERPIVLDPFAGSFSTGVASINMGCYPILIELDEEYYEKGIERIKKDTQQLRLF